MEELRKLALQNLGQEKLIRYTDESGNPAGVCGQVVKVDKTLKLQKGKETSYDAVWVVWGPGKWDSKRAFVAIIPLASIHSIEPLPNDQPSA